MRLHRRRFVSLLAAAAALRVMPASGQAWPSRPIRLIVPFPAGGSADLSARLLADHLKTALGQPVVVESKVGAGGNIAAAEAAHAEADGYTLFVGTNGTQTINQSLYRNLSYDPAADFASIAMMWEAPHLLVVHPSVPADTLEAFIAYAKAHPATLNYGSSGIGSSTHLFGEVFKARTGIAMTHVPYRGQGPALTDLVGGRLQAMFPIVPDVISYLRAGTLRALAVASAKPSAVLTNVSTMPQLGYPDLTASAWVGLYAPAKTPEPITRRLRQEVTALLENQTFIERMKQVGIEIHGMAPEEFAQFMREERARWGKVVQSLKLTID
jgi:tripartite-type tricarboxylate transporter receptor subunit TctC